MNHFHHKATVQAPQQTIYSIITDIESYPRIINNCHHANIINTTKSSDGSEKVHAELQLGIGPFTKKFVTHNYHRPNDLVKVQLESGSMRSLEGEWKLEKLSDTTTEVTCDFHFSLGNSAVDSVVAKVLKNYIKKSVDHYIALAEKSSNNS